MRKLIKAQKIAGVYGMTATSDHILRHIDKAIGINVIDNLTSKQIADLINLASYCYHQGRASTQAEVIDGDAVWIGAGVDKLIPLAALRAIKSDDRIEYTVDGPLPGCSPSKTPTQWRVTHYTLEFEERM